METASAAPGEKRIPSLFRNYISFIGLAIVMASLASVTLLFVMDITSAGENPYLGILTYIIFPLFLLFGLGVTGLGALIERRRRRRIDPLHVLAYPRLDLNDPATRRRFLAFLVLTFFFISASAFGSYRAFEYSESVPFCGETCHTVMKPEFTAYLAGAHARVACVDCHVGGGAESYIRSKFTGAYQLYSVTFNKYSRPIGSPVHNMRPATATCEKCHWPEKFYGEQMKTFIRYAHDEMNSLQETRMLINVGGGSPTSGPVAGIHWHMNLANKVEYIATDDRRQNIPWVRVTDSKGNVTDYVNRGQPVSDEIIARTSKRTMDCTDCHNRPAHAYLSPDAAVDQALTAGRLDISLPYIKRQAVEVLSRDYATTPEALDSIRSGLESFYRESYPDLHPQRSDAIAAAVGEVQQIFRTYMFPEMRTNWKSHPNNAGHLVSAGCFRCHDGQHFSSTGKVIRNDCSICHTTVYNSAAPMQENLRTGSFIHPVDLGSLATRTCASCHQADRRFVHPVNLGDISMFQCSDCHSK